MPELPAARAISSNPPPVVEAAQATQVSEDSNVNALAVSERQYRRLFEAARDGILLLDTDLGRITDANPFMTELLGYTYDELIGKELWEIGLLQDKEASQKAFQQLKQDNFIRYEDLPLENQHGERRQVEFVSNLYRENGHTVIQCNIRDITERRRSEDALRESEARLRLATEGAGIGIWQLVSGTNELTWTARCREIFGFSEDSSVKATGELFWSLIHPKDISAAKAVLEKAVRENTTFRDEYRVITPSGASRWVQSSGKPYYDAQGSFVRVEGILIDITEHKRAEAELAAAAVAVAEHGRQAAVLGERARLAREIHDTLAQGFTGISTQMEAAEATLDNLPVSDSPGSDSTYQTQFAAFHAQLEKVRGRVGKARDLARESLAEARRSVAAMRSPILEAVPLSEALARILTEKALGMTVKSRYVLEGIPFALPTDIEHCLLRIGQAAIANVVEHAQAQEVSVELSYDTEEVQLRVYDDGRGFDPTLPSAGRFGIIGMRERAEKAGGQLTVFSRVGGGTQVTFTMPIFQALLPQEAFVRERNEASESIDR